MLNIPFEITQEAQLQIKQLLIDETPETSLRIYVAGGGCSGFQYGFKFEDNPGSDDYVLKKGGAKLAIDPMSLQYLIGATLEYKSSLMGSQFVINNPNAETTCGCGSSFSV